MTYDDYIAILRSHILDKASKKVFQLLVEKFAFMAAGPQAYIAQRIITWILKKAIYETEMQVFFKYIDIRTDYQGEKLYEAMERNQDIQINGTESEKRESEKILIDRFRDFIKLAN